MCTYQAIDRSADLYPYIAECVCRRPTDKQKPKAETLLVAIVLLVHTQRHHMCAHTYPRCLCAQPTEKLGKARRRQYSCGGNQGVWILLLVHNRPNIADVPVHPSSYIPRSLCTADKQATAEAKCREIYWVSNHGSRYAISIYASSGCLCTH